MIVNVIVGGFLFVVFSVGLFCFLDIREEAKKFNKGVCKRCNSKMQLVIVAPFGDRGYACTNEKCFYVTWVKWDTVDNEFLEERGSDHEESDN